MFRCYAAWPASGNTRPVTMLYFDQLNAFRSFEVLHDFILQFFHVSLTAKTCFNIFIPTSMF